MNDDTQSLEARIGRLKSGDQTARDELVASACDHLIRLTRQMKLDFPVVCRWEETGDIFQTAVLRLCQALNSAKIENARNFRRLASKKLRETLIDLARKHSGPHGIGKNYESVLSASNSGNVDAAVDVEAEAMRLDTLLEMHEAIGQLDDDLREVIELDVYQSMRRKDIAELLGVSTKTVHRRSIQARLELKKLMDLN